MSKVSSGDFQWCWTETVEQSSTSDYKKFFNPIKKELKSHLFKNFVSFGFKEFLMADVIYYFFLNILVWYCEAPWIFWYERHTSSIIIIIIIYYYYYYYYYYCYYYYYYYYVRSGVVKQENLISIMLRRAKFTPWLRCLFKVEIRPLWTCGVPSVRNERYQWKVWISTIRGTCFLAQLFRGNKTPLWKTRRQSNPVF